VEPPGGTRMKRDPDFWFRLAMMAVLLAMFGIWLSYELNFFKEWFGGLFLGVLVLAIGYMGVSLVTAKRNKAVVPSPVAAEQTRDIEGRRKWGNLIRAVCIGGMALLIQLPKDGFLPNWALVVLYGALFGGWMWYELVGSKSEEVGR
jgi:hypothetical protein